jgi:hypothetical protein
MVNVEILNNENSLDHFISDEKKVIYKTVSAKNLAGWVDGWAAGKAGLRIAYSNQKVGKVYEGGFISFAVKRKLREKGSPRAGTFTLVKPGLGPINNKFSDLRNFQKKLENLKPTIFARRVRKLSSWCFSLACLIEV